jgi:hypothetical protein
MRLPFGNLLGRNSNANTPQRASKRRRHPRLPFDSPVTICWLEDDHLRVLHANLINASEGGMAARASAPLALGTRLWVLLDDGADGCGEVCDCEPLGDEHRIGMKFIAERRSDPPDDVPDQYGVPDQYVLEWIDQSGRLIGSFVSVRSADSKRIEMLAPEVVPCPGIVLLSGNRRRRLCCTRDWRPEQDSYLVEADLIRDIVPTTANDPIPPATSQTIDPDEEP